MYEIEYHVIAKNWNRQNIIVNPFFFHHKADMRVNIKKANMSTVAIHLVGANILLIWFTGPIKKHVLAKATILPNVYSNAKGAEI